MWVVTKWPQFFAATMYVSTELDPSVRLKIHHSDCSTKISKEFESLNFICDTELCCRYCMLCVVCSSSMSCRGSESFAVVVTAPSAGCLILSVGVTINIVTDDVKIYWCYRTDHRDTNKFLESRVAVFSAHTNVIKITIPKKWRTLWKTSCYWAEEYATSLYVTV